jgi:CHASE2 domain-containing sensor protein
MMHPLFHLITSRPQLLADHAEAYAELVASEAPRVSAAWKRSALLNALALCSLVVGLVLAGVALMLWAVFPDPPMRAAWALLAVPLLPLAAAVACAVAAQMGGARDAFENLRQQVKADIAMLREAATV